MNPKQAEAIVIIYGEYVARMHGKLAMYFPLYIPELLLPYPKKTIHCALELAAGNSSNLRFIELCKELAALLPMYVEEKKALWDKQEVIMKNLMSEEMHRSREQRAKNWIIENYPDAPPYDIE